MTYGRKRAFRFFHDFGDPAFKRRAALLNHEVKQLDLARRKLLGQGRDGLPHLDGFVVIVEPVGGGFSLHSAPSEKVNSDKTGKSEKPEKPDKPSNGKVFPLFPPLPLFPVFTFLEGAEFMPPLTAS